MKEGRLELACACAAAFAFSSNYTNHAPLAPMLMKQFGFTLAKSGLLTGWTGSFHAAFVSLAAFSAAVLVAALFIRD